MSYVATVLRVLIASPSDVHEARSAAERAIYDWNNVHARSETVILHPWRWERSAVPVMGAHPQQIINAQGVDDSDIVFALFGARLGSPTPAAVSGTVEEIDRAQKMQIPVHVYFSTAPMPSDVDIEQVKALRAFKQQIQDRGLLGEFRDLESLRFEVWKAIEHDIATMPLPGSRRVRDHVTGVDFLVQPGQEREVSSLSSKGAPRYTTRRWLDITNRGEQDAVQVTFESVNDSGMILVGPGNPTTIHAGQTRRLPMVFTWQGSADPVLRIRWEEDGEQKVRDFHVG